VTLDHVVKRYGSVSALASLSLRAPAGRIYGLVGPDGAGKTTALELICGLRAPTAGRVSVLGLDPIRQGARLAPDLGFVSQDFTLYGSLTVEENLDFFARIHDVPPRVRRERKARLLGFARLEPFARRRAERLSGGMKKKLALCCALVHQPRLVVLDEPTTGVDPVSRRELWEIVFGFIDTGITVLVTTPYMDEAEQCHEVGLMAGGRLLAAGTPDELRRLVDGDVLQIRARPLRRVDDLVRRLPGWLDSTSFGDRLHVRVSSAGAFRAGLEDEVRGDGVALEEVRSIEPTLEDVFLARNVDGSAAQSARTDEPRSVGAIFGPARADDPRAPIVEVDGLVRRFGAFEAVGGISLRVQRGEIFGFLGPNGAGKTTTIRMLCGLLPPTAGAIRVAGIDVRRTPAALRPHVGYMSQQFSLYADLTVVENLRLFGGLYGVPRRALRDRISWVVDMAGLAGCEHWLTRRLSGGWRQRLALGAALLHDPDVLFLDEPTSGVDPASRRRFWDLIYRLADRGTSVFVTTHYMDEAEHCHRLALVYRGRIIAENSPLGLRRRMQAGALVELECDRPLAAIRTARGEDYVWTASLFGKTVHVVVDDLDRDEPRLLEALAGDGVAVSRAEPIMLSLEDLFVLFIAMHDRQLEEIRHG